MPLQPASFSLDIFSLQARYQSGEITPEKVIEEIYARMEGRGDAGIWITRVSRESALKTALALKGKDPRMLPLYGVPFAVKDNIDVVGTPTTAGCPAFAFLPSESAFVVNRLLDAGAILIGKTNMDQFAAGLVGTRSPYGECLNAFNKEYISGGSSSGSAVAVAAGFVSFALGTDTAGSGRVPAAFNNLVGYKPTRGIWSTHGVVPACRSLDCVSVFSLTVADSKKVARVVQGYDARSYGPRRVAARAINTKQFRFGVPAKSELRFFGDDAAERLYYEACTRMEACGGTRVEISYEPFRKTAELLYGGPWVAERYAGIESFLRTHADEVFPVTRQIVEKGAAIGGADVFNGLHALDCLRTTAAYEWEKMDVMVLPTAGTIYPIRDVVAEPVTLNTNLGYYTNFVNLLDCSAIALPAGFRPDGLPFGISLIAPAMSDEALFQLGQQYELRGANTMGATGIPFSSATPEVSPPATVRLAVVGAHLQGQPLNRELTELNARLVWSGMSAPLYRFYALQTTPPKPGMIKVEDGSGAAIELEVWELDFEAFGRFVANVPSPLAIGTLHLENGESVKGFVCEPAAIASAKDITHFGGWRRFRSSLA